MELHRSIVVLAVCVFVALTAAVLRTPPGPATATGGNSITSPDTVDDVGRDSSVALDGAGNPVVSYYDGTNRALKVLHCNDPNCSGGDESITTVDVGTLSAVGGRSSLVLDGAGNPVASYYDFVGDVKLLHCNDPNCSGGDESITTVAGSFDVGRNNSLALDSSGIPVISYLLWTLADLVVMRCGNADCTKGNKSTAPDTEGIVGIYNSLALDGAGNPVVSYLDVTNGDLKVLHCNDLNCSGGDESITAPDTEGSGIWELYSSLVLDTNGNPVVSYYDFVGDLKVLHCNDPDCAGGDDSITTPDTEGVLEVFGGTSLELDASGNPVVSYYDRANGDLKVLHCGNPACTDLIPVGGIAELPDVAGTPLEAEGSWVPSAGVVAGVVTAVAAGALALGGAAWYARRWRSS